MDLLEAWRRGRLHDRVLVVAAHPDDETIGCGGALGRCDDAWVLHVTDGVPEDPRYTREAGFASAEDYRAARANESLSALSLAGVPPRRVSSLWCPDQKATERLAELVPRLVARIAALAPALVVTHAYEGGHPDHDATRFLVGRALEAQTGARPALVEMTGYHAQGRGRFLVDHGHVSLALSSQELVRKREMLACYRSQAAVLRPFLEELDCLDGVASWGDLEDERLRYAPAVDFTRPPGPLHYERFDWGMTGERFRALIREVA